MQFSNLTNDEKTILYHIQKNGPLTKNEILDVMPYKAGTLNRIIAMLADKGVISECGQEKSTGGRKPSLFDVNTLSKYLIGIDISRTNFTVVLTNMKIQVIHGVRKSFDPFGDVSPATVVRDVIAAIDTILVSKNLTRDKLYGIGIGMVGPVDPSTGVVKNVMHFRSPGWVGFALKDVIVSEFGVPVYVDCGSYVATLAEYLYGEARGQKSISYINCGIGIRSGFISSGVLIRSVNNDESSFEHTIINPMGERCSCGKRGCVRCYASTFTISENVRRRISLGEKSKIHKEPEKIIYLDVVEAAAKGDEVCIYELSTAGNYFGIALANYIILLSPAQVIIGGMLATVSSDFYNAAIKSAEANYITQSEIDITFKQGGRFQEKSIAVGAAAMVFEKSIGSRIMD